VASTHDDLMCFTNTGRVFKMKVLKIPEMGRTARGRAIVNLLELRTGEQVVAFQPIEDFERSEDYLLFGTALGRVKHTSLKDYRNVHRSGIIAINLNEGDRLIDVVLTRGSDDVLLATKNGMAIRFHENDARVMGRSAAGVRGIDLKAGDEVVGLVRADDGADLLTVTVNGFGKRTALSDYLVHLEDGTTRPQSRGGKGRIDIRTTARNGPVVAIVCVQEETDGIVFVSALGMIVRVPVKTISRIGRATQGVTLVKLKQGDRLIAAARVVESDEAGEAGEASEEIPDV
jgi:DNA gyrase subunit A